MNRLNHRVAYVQCKKAITSNLEMGRVWDREWMTKAWRAAQCGPRFEVFLRCILDSIKTEGNTKYGFLHLESIAEIKPFSNQQNIAEIEVNVSATGTIFFF